jgi:hypothetical protein
MIPNNLNSVQQNSTASYFNNISVNNPSFDVSLNEDNAITSFFEKLSGDKTNGIAMARAFIYTAKAQSLDVMTVFQQFVELPPGQINSYLVMFLNLNRVGTSYLGLSNSPPPNKYIVRSILP